MTPQELIETAQFLNPEKCEAEPAEALQDALAYIEALKRLEAINSAIVDIAQTKIKPAPASSNRDTPKSLVAELSHHYQHRGHTMAEIGNAVGVSSTIGLWLKGKTKPTRDKLAKIRLFLDAQNEAQA